VLTNDPMMGVFRHADAGYERRRARATSTATASPTCSTSGDLAANFGAGPGATREQGDLTGDGFVDVFDFGELAADFGCVAD
jgi:hypothetical protein